MRAHQEVAWIAAHHEGVEGQCFVFENFTHGFHIAPAQGTEQEMHSTTRLLVTDLCVGIAIHEAMARAAAHRFLAGSDDKNIVVKIFKDIVYFYRNGILVAAPFDLSVFAPSRQTSIDASTGGAAAQAGHITRFPIEGGIAV